jgi:hypothetical protein
VRNLLSCHHPKPALPYAPAAPSLAKSPTPRATSRTSISSFCSPDTAAATSTPPQLSPATRTKPSPASPKPRARQYPTPCTTAARDHVPESYTTHLPQSRAPTSPPEIPPRVRVLTDHVDLLLYPWGDRSGWPFPPGRNLAVFQGRDEPCVSTVSVRGSTPLTEVTKRDLLFRFSSYCCGPRILVRASGSGPTTETSLLHLRGL